MSFSDIKLRGTRGDDFKSTGVSNSLKCADGFTMSVIAGGGAYAVPREGGGPYSHVEVGFPSERPEPWSAWESFSERADDPTGTVYGFVPVTMVEALIESHGGER